MREAAARANTITSKMIAIDFRARPQIGDPPVVTDMHLHTGIIRIGRLELTVDVWLRYVVDVSPSRIASICNIEQHWTMTYMLSPTRSCRLKYTGIDEITHNVLTVFKKLRIMQQCCGTVLERTAFNALYSIAANTSRSVDHCSQMRH